MPRFFDVLYLWTPLHRNTDKTNKIGLWLNDSLYRRPTIAGAYLSYQLGHLIAIELIHDSVVDVDSHVDDLFWRCLIPRFVDQCEHNVNWWKFIQNVCKKVGRGSPIWCGWWSLPNSKSEIRRIQGTWIIMELGKIVQKNHVEWTTVYQALDISQDRLLSWNFLIRWSLIEKNAM